MKVELKSTGKGMHFIATGESGNMMELDAAEEIGGTNNGVRPMESLLMALGGCSGIDVYHILRHERDKIKELNISIEGEREKVEEVKLYKNIHVKFHFKGEIDQAKAERAASLSMEKYCSVAKTLEKTANITHEVILN